MKIQKLFLAASLLTISVPAFAYLDPGTGNALIYFLISLLGAFTFYVKSLFYKVTGLIKGQQRSEDYKGEVVIFSEGKNYWQSYNFITDKLIEKKIHFQYLTTDVEDPALTIDSPYMHSKFVGEGAIGYSRVAQVKGKILLTTTPNIGCKNFPLPRPRNIKYLVHFWHSVSDTSFYHLGALDFHDCALTVAPWVEKSIREIEKVRNLPKKEIFPVGLPYFDNSKVMSTINKQHAGERKTVLIAPSWGKKSCLNIYGIDFIPELLRQGYNVIVRPHPHSLKVEPETIHKFQLYLKDFSNVAFDFNTQANDSMEKADILISDKSSVRFDFAFLYEKPVLTLDIPHEDLQFYEAALLSNLWEEEQAKKLGEVISVTDKANICRYVQETLLYKPSDIRRVRDSALVNWQNSASVIVDWIENKLQVID